MSMPFAAQNQWKRFKNKVVFQSRPYAYESMSSYYSGVGKVCPWNPDFPVIHVFCKPLKLHNGRRAENCCRSYKRSRLSHEPLTPWALVLQVGTVGLQAGGRHRWVPFWPGGEVQVYHWGQDADVFIPLTSAAGLSLTSHFFLPKMLHIVWSSNTWEGTVSTGTVGPVAASLSMERRVGIYWPDFSTPELHIQKPARTLELNAVFSRGFSTASA